MRTITVTTDRPWLHPGYRVIGAGKAGETRLRLESEQIDSGAARYLRMMEIVNRDPEVRIEISEVK